MRVDILPIPLCTPCSWRALRSSGPPSREKACCAVVLALLGLQRRVVLLAAVLGAGTAGVEGATAGGVSPGLARRRRERSCSVHVLCGGRERGRAPLGLRLRAGRTQEQKFRRRRFQEHPYRFIGSKTSTGRSRLSRITSRWLPGANHTLGPAVSVQGHKPCGQKRSRTTQGRCAHGCKI